MKEQEKYFELKEEDLDEKEKKFMNQLNELLHENSVDKEIFDLIMEYMLNGKDPEGEEYVDSIEVDGKTYFSTYEFDIQGIFYTQFVNEEDAADVLFMRHLLEVEENYYEDLDSEYEKKWVYVFEQKFIFEGVKRKLEAELEELKEKLKKEEGIE